MTQAEAIQTLQANAKLLHFEHPYLGIKEAIEVVIEALSQPSLPSDLDEAAKEYADYNSRRWHEDGDVYYDHSKILEAFKAGAEWMAGKYKTLGETEIYLEDDGGEAPYTQEWLDLATTEFAVPEGFKPGDKVIVQIRKK